MDGFGQLAGLVAPTDRYTQKKLLLAPEEVGALLAEGATVLLVHLERFTVDSVGCQVEEWWAVFRAVLMIELGSASVPCTDVESMRSWENAKEKKDERLDGGQHLETGGGWYLVGRGRAKGTSRAFRSKVYAEGTKRASREGRLGQRG